MIFSKIKALQDQGKTVGITFSQFDLLHAGHVAMLSEAKNHCDYLIAGLQNNAGIRPGKNTPIQSIVERQIMLSSQRFVDEIVVYNTEDDIEDILLTLPINVRIIGIEYKDKPFTGQAVCMDRNIKIVYNSRDHSFSSSNLRQRVTLMESNIEKII
jgi:glycerol-3-phosphate cytidylyltransferase